MNVALAPSLSGAAGDGHSAYVRLAASTRRAMPTLTVPKEYASGLSRIVDLSPEESKRIANALQKAKTSNLRELTELVALAVPELPIREAREIVETLRSLYGA